MDKIEYYMVRLLFEIFKRIPFAIVRYVGIFFAFVTQHIIRYRCTVVRENLQRAFPEYSEPQIRRTMRDVYINFSFLWIEWLQSWRFNKKFIEKNCVIENFGVLEAAAKENKGLILYSGHLGNFEWVAGYVQHYFGQVTGIMRRMHNKYINDFAVSYRKQMGFGVIYTDGAFDRSLEMLRDGKYMGVAGDQDAHEKGVFVEFFGIPSSTAAGAALFHLRTGAPVIFVCGAREKWGKFKFYFEKVPLPADNEETAENIYRITQNLTSTLEKYIRLYPGQYFWTHRRWKTKPSDEVYEEYKQRVEKLMDRSLRS